MERDTSHSRDQFSSLQARNSVIMKSLPQLSQRVEVSLRRLSQETIDMYSKRSRDNLRLRNASDRAAIYRLIFDSDEESTETSSEKSYGMRTKYERTWDTDWKATQSPSSLDTRRNSRSARRRAHLKRGRNSSAELVQPKRRRSRFLNTTTDDTSTEEEIPSERRTRSSRVTDAQSLLDIHSKNVYEESVDTSRRYTKTLRRAASKKRRDSLHSSVTSETESVDINTNLANEASIVERGNNTAAVLDDGVEKPVPTSEENIWDVRLSSVVTANENPSSEPRGTDTTAETLRAEDGSTVVIGGANHAWSLLETGRNRSKAKALSSKRSGKYMDPKTCVEVMSKLMTRWSALRTYYEKNLSVADSVFNNMPTTPFDDNVHSVSRNDRLISELYSDSLKVLKILYPPGSIMNENQSKIIDEYMVRVMILKEELKAKFEKRKGMKRVTSRKRTVVHHDTNSLATEGSTSLTSNSSESNTALVTTGQLGDTATPTASAIGEQQTSAADAQSEVTNLLEASATTSNPASTFVCKIRVRDPKSLGINTDFSGAGNTITPGTKDNSNVMNAANTTTAPTTGVANSGVSSNTTERTYAPWLIELAIVLLKDERLCKLEMLQNKNVPTGSSNGPIHFEDWLSLKPVSFLQLVVRVFQCFKFEDIPTLYEKINASCPSEKFIESDLTRCLLKVNKFFRKLMTGGYNHLNAPLWLAQQQRLIQPDYSPEASVAQQNNGQVDYVHQESVSQPSAQVNFIYQGSQQQQNSAPVNHASQGSVPQQISAMVNYVRGSSLHTQNSAPVNNTSQGSTPEQIAAMVNHVQRSSVPQQNSAPVNHFHQGSVPEQIAAMVNYVRRSSLPQQNSVPVNQVNHGSVPEQIAAMVNYVQRSSLPTQNSAPVNLPNQGVAPQQSGAQVNYEHRGPLPQQNSAPVNLPNQGVVPQQSAAQVNYEHQRSLPQQNSAPVNLPNQGVVPQQSAARVHYTHEASLPQQHNVSEAHQISVSHQANIQVNYAQQGFLPQQNKVQYVFSSQDNNRQNTYHYYPCNVNSSQLSSQDEQGTNTQINPTPVTLGIPNNYPSTTHAPSGNQEVSLQQSTDTYSTKYPSLSHLLFNYPSGTLGDDSTNEGRPPPPPYSEVMFNREIANSDSGHFGRQLTGESVTNTTQLSNRVFGEQQATSTESNNAVESQFLVDKGASGNQLQGKNESRIVRATLVNVPVAPAVQATSVDKRTLKRHKFRVVQAASFHAPHLPVMQPPEHNSRARAIQGTSRSQGQTSTGKGTLGNQAHLPVVEATSRNPPDKADGTSLAGVQATSPFLQTESAVSVIVAPASAMQTSTANTSTSVTGDAEVVFVYEGVPQQRCVSRDSGYLTPSPNQASLQHNHGNKEARWDEIHHSECAAMTQEQT